MNSLQRNKRVLYWAKRDTTVDYEKYLEPQELRFNYRTISNEAVIESTGSIGTAHLIIKDVNSKIEPLNVGDRIYLSKPSTFNISASDADYMIASKTIGLDFGELILRAMVGINGKY